MTFKEVSFDLDDKNLFLVDDLKLKAEAIRHSILPKLEIITNYSISLINERLRTNVLELSTVLKSPNFRKNGVKKFNKNYTYSTAGLGGKRSKELWKPIIEKGKTQLPFMIRFYLLEDGLFFYFLTKSYITIKDFSLFYNFHLAYSNEIATLVNESGVSLEKFYSPNENDSYKFTPFSPLNDYLKWQLDSGFWDLRYFSTPIKYPILNDEIELLVNDFIMFYPIYDSYLRLASGQPVLLNKHIELLNEWLISTIDKENPPLDQHKKGSNLKQGINLLNLAETKIKVMPALRWQVFQRDNWKCVACGRTTEDGIILHVDHILPRSKGGTDHIDNYQTLCNICNIGKSNKDQTNLRERD